MTTKQTLNLEMLLDRVSLIDLAEDAGTTLTKRGKDYRGPCPLHGGSNPTAFSVSADGKHWHCFADCDEGGDAIAFVQRLEGFADSPDGFLATVRLLADRAGLTLADLGMTEEDAEEYAEHRKQARTRRQLLTLAADYYRDVLASERGQQGRTYAAQRGWSDETIIESGLLGYSNGRLRAYLQEQGADLQAAAKAGLLWQTDDGRLVDAILDGYLVYIHMHYNNVVYLTGRATFTDDKAKKSRNLRAPKQLFWARVRGSGPLVIVEGQADALTVREWGLNAVALCGSSLNEKDLRAIRGYSPIYLMLDSDEDGQEKTATVADLLGPLTMIVPPIPEEGITDTNDWQAVGAGPEEMRDLLDEATPWIEVAIDHARTAPAYMLESHLVRLAELMLALKPAMRGKYLREICDNKRLTTRKEFRALLAEQGGKDSDTNGFAIKDGKLVHRGEPLCNFSARITHELTLDDGQHTPDVHYTVVGTLATGEPLEPIEDLSAEKFDTMRWVSAYWGARAIFYVAPSKYWQIRWGIQELSKHDLIREKVHQFTGWTVIDGTRYFLTTSGGIHKDGLDESIRVDLGEGNMGRYELPAPPADLTPAIEASLDFLELADIHVTLPLWAAMYAAPLGEFQTLDATLWVYGQTQSGKSTLSHLALTHFGPSFIDGHKYKAPQDWISTVTDLEIGLFQTKDVATIIDDYAPSHGSASKARKLKDKAEHIIRIIGNRAVKGRRRPDLSEQDKYPPRGLLIATAEQPIIGHSTVGRTIYVPVQKGDILDEAGSTETTDLDRAQQQAMDGRYAEAMAGYVQWLIERWDDLEDDLPAALKHLSREARGKITVNQNRLYDYYSLLMAAIRLALRYAVDVGVLNKYEAEIREEQYEQVIVTVLENQGERVDSESPVRKFWEAVADLVAQEKVYFGPRLKLDYTRPAHADRIGWYDEEPNGNVYLKTTPALAHVKEYWKSVDEPFATQADALRRYFDQHGLITNRAKRQYEEKQYINKKLRDERVLWLSKQRLQAEFDLTFGEQTEDGDAMDAVEF